LWSISATGAWSCSFTSRQGIRWVELADGTRRFLLIVSGDDAYISNDWYGLARQCLDLAL